MPTFQFLFKQHISFNNRKRKAPVEVRVQTRDACRHAVACLFGNFSGHAPKLAIWDANGPGTRAAKPLLAGSRLLNEYSHGLHGHGLYSYGLWVVIARAGGETGVVVGCIGPPGVREGLAARPTYG